MLPPIQTFNIVPKLPPALEPLREIVYNLWWSWEPAARRLFRKMDPELWERTNHNPLRQLQLSRQARLEELARDESFLREVTAVHKQFQAYMARQDTYGRLRAKAAGFQGTRATISWRISPPSSASTSPCRITPAAWASSPATIANRPATST